ncbi:MAG: PEP-CTERM sorting domain-containing protein, partial [Planctomycetales bacterium]|nr:PEP-CTERM sorting domain-containing protein [Planctomycetales bacterium]
AGVPEPTSLVLVVAAAALMAAAGRGRIGRS